MSDWWLLEVSPLTLEATEDGCCLGHQLGQLARHLHTALPVVSLPQSTVTGFLEWASPVDQAETLLPFMAYPGKARGIASSAATGLPRFKRREYRLHSECRWHILERACGMGDPVILLENTTCAVTFWVKGNNGRKKRQEMRTRTPGVGSGVVTVSCSQQKIRAGDKGRRQSGSDRGAGEAGGHSLWTGGRDTEPTATGTDLRVCPWRCPTEENGAC